MVESNRSAAHHQIVIRLGVIVLRIAPRVGSCRLIRDLRVGIRIEQPERDIDPLDLVDVVLILEDLREQPFSRDVLLQCRLRRLFIELERYHVIRLENPGELIHHNDRISAEGTGGRRSSHIAYDLTTAGLAGVDPHSFRLARRPFSSGIGVPVQIIGFFLLQYRIIAFERFKVEFVVAERTFHLLQRTVKGDRSAAAGTFIFL